MLRVHFETIPQCTQTPLVKNKREKWNLSLNQAAINILILLFACWVILHVLSSTDFSNGLTYLLFFFNREYHVLGFPVLNR